MNTFKLILIAAGLILAVLLAFLAISLISSALWYVFLFGIIAVGGAVGYKLLIKDKEPARLEDKTPVTIAEMQNADRALEEYKRKYLPK